MITDKPFAVSTLNTWINHVALLNQGQVVTAMAALSLGLRREAALSVVSDNQDRLRAAAAAAATLAREWAQLTSARLDRLEEVLALGEKTPAWVLCPDCVGFFCRLHRMHVNSCLCPPLEDWHVNPYVAGGPTV